MPHRHQWQSRIKSVEREYAAMRQAADRLAHADFGGPEPSMPFLQFPARTLVS